MISYHTSYNNVNLESHRGRQHSLLISETVTKAAVVGEKGAEGAIWKSPWPRGLLCVFPWTQ